jgi:adenylosuccinate synthase
VRRLRDLPEAARRYVERLADLSRVPLTMISVGPEREQLIHL